MTDTRIPPFTRMFTRIFTRTRVLVLAIIVLIGSSSFYLGHVMAASAPSINSTCEPGGCSSGGAFDFNVYVDSSGPTYLASKSAGGGNSYKETNFQTLIQTDIEGDPICMTGCGIHINSGVFTITSTITINPLVKIDGNGAGYIWNGLEGAQTELKCNLSSNNVPCLKLTNAVLESGVVLSNFKLFYTGTATGTDGIYLDGVNSPNVIRITFNNLNIIGFSGYGMHAVGTVFDVRSYSLGFYGGAASAIGKGNLLVEPSGASTPSQWYMYGPVSIATCPANCFGFNITTSDGGIFGGTITASQSVATSGICIKGSGSFNLVAVHVEGGLVAGEVGIRYSGTGFNVIAGDVFSWGTGVQIGVANASSASASNWYINSGFSGNTVDLSITSGGTRRGVLGPFATSTLTTIRNTRNTGDGVASELVKQYEPSNQPLPTTFTSPATGNNYGNVDFYNEVVNVYCNTCTAVNMTLQGPTGLGKEICAAFPCTAFMPPGYNLWYTYATATPVSVKSYGGP